MRLGRAAAPLLGRVWCEGVGNLSGIRIGMASSRKGVSPPKSGVTAPDETGHAEADGARRRESGGREGGDLQPVS
ncbi:hypothetical protein GCM10010440_10650 [Kitasatospora cinereorecta]